MLRHCADARYVWNLCVEQGSWWRRGGGRMPGFNERCRQLTFAREDNPWLAAGSVIVQQQAIRDYTQAIAKFFNGTHGRPSWRKAGRNEGFRIVGLRPEDVRRLSRHVGEIRIPKAGWVRFRWSRPVPAGVKSFRITRDRAGRWHIAFAAIPGTIPRPGNGEVVGVDRGVAVSAALSTGELLHAPRLSASERKRLVRLQRRFAHARKGSRRRGQVKLATARLCAREADRRRDWVEKLSTRLARDFDVIRVEDINVKGVTRSAKGSMDRPGCNVRQKAGLNRGILSSGWGMLAHRLADKASGRVEKIPAAYTSQQCSACGLVDANSRKSQAVFVCTACGYACNADVNAARNIAAGHAVTARGRSGLPERMNREPQSALCST